MVRRAEHQLQAVLVDYQRIMLDRFHVDPRIAETVAAEMLDVLRRHLGGAEVYIRPPQRYDVAAVLRDFTGDNHDQVIKKHGIARRTLYRILQRASAPPVQTGPRAPRRARDDGFSW